MSVQLYYAPGACSFVPHGLLELAGVAFEPKLVKLHKGEQSAPAFLAINPHGQVPVLVDHGRAVTQIVAIVDYIDRAYAAGRLLPTDPMARAHVMERLAWMNNTAHPTFTHVFMPGKFTDDSAAQAAVRAHNIKKFRDCLAEVDQMAAKAAPWIAGSEIGPLDLYALTLMRWGGFAGIDPKSWPNLWPHSAKVAAHPAIAKVVAREKLELDVKPLG